MFKKSLPALAAIGLAFSAAQASATVTAPELSNIQVTPIRSPYPQTHAAHTALREAQAQAIKEKKLLLIDFGANWCPDCRILAGTLDNPAVQPWIKQNFVPVMINLNHFDENMDLPEQFHITVKSIPTVIVVTPEGKILNKKELKALGDARSMAPQEIVDLLANWANRTTK